MGLVYSSSESAELIQALTSNLASGKEAANQLKAGSQQVVAAVDGHTLAGAAYTAGKGLFSELIIPMITRTTTACEVIEQELLQYQAADQIVSGENYLDENILNQKIATKKAMQASIEIASNVVITAARSNPSATILDTLLDFQRNLNCMSESIQDDIEQLNKKLEKLHNFASQTSVLFNNSLNDLKSAIQGVLVLNGTIVNSDGSYTLPAGIDKSWFVTLQNGNTVKKIAQKQTYIRSLQEQFGFDEDTANQIYKMKEGIDKKFPKLPQKERDYLLARILGEFSYGEGLKNQMMWPNTAGDLGDYFYNEFNHHTGETLKSPKDLKAILSDLELSDKEYKGLYYNLRLQHEMSGSVFISSDQLKNNYQSYKDKYIEAYGKENADEFDNFWNEKAYTFTGKGDFTHQSITTATILDNNIRLANMSGIVTGRFDSKAVDELAGWRGDTTKVPAEKPSIGNDDYKADLDVVNITQRMKNKNVCYTQASNDYYNGLSNGQVNRAEEFNNNSGFDYVKNEILSDLAPNYEYTAGNIKYQTKIEERPDAHNANTKRNLTEQDKLDYLKEHYPASYNFIESLKNNDNEYTDYTNRGG